MRHAIPIICLLVACAPRVNTTENARKVGLSMAEQLARRGDWAGAFSAADALARQDPSDMEVRLFRGVTLRHQGLLSEAEADFRRVIAEQPRNPSAHAELALLLEERHKPEEALLEHKDANRLAPHEPRYLNDLGFALVIHGEAKAAIPLLEEALRTEPTNSRYRNNLGFACAADGDFARAAHEFASGGTPAQARNNLGLAYERAGDFGHAYDLYLEAWKLDGDVLARTNLEHAAKKLARPLPAEVTAHKEGT